MADENRLKDARIKVVIDTSDAIQQIEDAKVEPEKSVPGGKPPSPGRKDEQRKREDEEREEKRDPRPRRPRRPAARPGRGGGLLRRVVGTAASGVTLSMVADMIPAIIQAEQKKLAEGQYWERQVVGVIEKYVGQPLERVADGLRAVESALPAIAAFTGTAIDVSRSNQLMGLGMSPQAIASLSKREAAIASIGANMNNQRRKVGREAVGVFLADEIGKMRDEVQRRATNALSGAAAVNK